MKIRPLKTEFRKDGFNYRQIERNDDIAIFSQKKHGLEWFEVIVVQKRTPHPHDPDAGNWDLVEIYPSSEQWGQAGWTFKSYDKAKNRGPELLATARERAGAQTP